jgi:hypothetical protein
VCISEGIYIYILSHLPQVNPDIHLVKSSININMDGVRSIYIYICKQAWIIQWSCTLRKNKCSKISDFIWMQLTALEDWDLVSLILKVKLVFLLWVLFCLATQKIQICSISFVVVIVHHLRLKEMWWDVVHYKMYKCKKYSYTCMLYQIMLWLIVRRRRLHKFV